MCNIYDSALEQVKQGRKFSINFETRTLKVDGKTIIDHGKYEGSLGISPAPLSDVLERIERLFDSYNHSIPSAQSLGKRRHYFRALKEHDLDNDDMLYGVPREFAQVSLELYVLCMVLNGSFTWDETKLGKWFWQSATYPDLIILKKWIC